MRKGRGKNGFKDPLHNQEKEEKRFLFVLIDVRLKEK